MDGDTIHLQDPNDHRDHAVSVATFRRLFELYQVAGDAAPHDPPPGGPVETERV